MAALNTGSLSLPNQILDPWLGKVQGGSTVAVLSGQTPMKFGTGQYMTFNIGEAELVAEGANKGPSTVTPTVKTVKPFKFQKTVRMTDEVLWADEDAQQEYLQQILDLIQPALSRALDFGVYHGINPATGATAAAITEFLDQATNEVETTTVLADVDAATGLVLAGGYSPSGVALDPAYAARAVTSRNATTDQKTFPDFRPTLAPSSLDGWPASTSRTVGAGGVAATPTGDLAFLGDFSAIRWGVQRAIGLERIDFGDPDGQGDLKRNNQVAFRAEVVYGWGIADLAAFAKIVVAG